MKSSNKLSGLAAGLLWFVVGGGTSPAQQPDPPRKPGPKDLPEFMQPADPKRMAEGAKRLAGKVLPTAEEMKANGDWKLPWEFPAMASLPLPWNVEERTRAWLYRLPQDRYWARHGGAAAFIGLTPEEAAKRRDDVLRELKAEGGNMLTDRQSYIGLMALATLFHPASPTLAASQEALADVQMEIAKGPGDADRRLLAIGSADRLRARALAFDRNYEGVKDEELKERVVDVLTANQKWTRFTLWRSTNNGKLLRMGEAAQELDDLWRQYDPNLGDDHISTQVFTPEKMSNDPRFPAAQKRYRDAQAGDGQVQERIAFSMAVVNVRLISPDVIGGYVKDMSEADRGRLEQKLDEVWKAALELTRPGHEKEQVRLRDSIERERRAGNGAEAEKLQKLLDEKERAWRANASQSVRVAKRNDVGAADCYVISSRQFAERQPDRTYYMTSLRNGTCIAELDIVSEMPEDEARKDLEFLLKALQTGTSRAAGATK